MLTPKGLRRLIKCVWMTLSNYKDVKPRILNSTKIFIDSLRSSFLSIFSSYRNSVYTSYFHIIFFVYSLSFSTNRKYKYFNIKLFDIFDSLEKLKPSLRRLKSLVNIGESIYGKIDVQKVQNR